MGYDFAEQKPYTLHRRIPVASAHLTGCRRRIALRWRTAVSPRAELDRQKRNPASYIPTAKLPLIQNAVLNACDELDGVKDRLLEDARMCRFDPAVLMCQSTYNSECLTRPQVEALTKIYGGAKNPRTGEAIFPGVPTGSEAAAFAGWSLFITGATPGQAALFLFANSHFGEVVFEDPKWDLRKLNFDSDVKLSDDKAAPVLNADNPDLRSFRAEGGKLIQFHGWGDAAVSALSSIEYLEKVQSFLSKYPDARSDSSRH